MKKLLVILSGVMICLLLSTLQSYAGSLNEQEQRVLDTVSVKVEYDKKLYRLSDSSYGRLRAYFLQDSVDLSMEDADRFIEGFFSNIKDAIDGGYMVYLGKVKTDPPIDPTKPTDPVQPTPPTPIPTQAPPKDAVIVVEVKPDDRDSSKEEVNSEYSNLFAMLAASGEVPGISQNSVSENMVSDNSVINVDDEDNLGQETTKVLSDNQLKSDSAKDFSGEEAPKKSINPIVVIEMIVIILLVIGIISVLVHRMNSKGKFHE